MDLPHNIIFDNIFHKTSNPETFESHNMMYTIELLRETFVLNDINVGDFTSLWKKLVHDKDLKLISKEQALHPSFPWPNDMIENYTWDKENAKSLFE